MMSGLQKVREDVDREKGARLDVERSCEHGMKL